MGIFRILGTLVPTPPLVQKDGVEVSQKNPQESSCATLTKTYTCVPHIPLAKLPWKKRSKYLKRKSLNPKPENPGSKS